ncbi:MAG: hypothetical protein HY763_02370 [Planctomycetes bacterium]|nr:hypothetical protein [Planctomycetota bacterium]
MRSEPTLRRLTVYFSDRRTFFVEVDPRAGPSPDADVRIVDTGLALMPRQAADILPLAEQIGQALRDTYPDGATCRAVLPAAWCFIHVVTVPTAQWTAEAAAFEFEPLVPVPLEQLTWSCRRLGEDKALVVAVFTEAIAVLLRHLEENGVDAEVVAVDALVAADAADARSSGGRVVVLVDDQHVTIAKPDFGGGEVAPFRTFRRPAVQSPDADRQLLLGAAPVGENRTTALVHVLGGAEATKPTVELLSGALDFIDVSAPEVAVPLLCREVHKPNVLDLRRQSLVYSGRWRGVRTCGRRSAVAFAVLLAACGVGLRVENVRYTEALEDLRPLRDGVYRRVFPDGAVPAAAGARLRSELAKLTGVTRQAAEAAVVSTSSGLALVEQLAALAALLPEQTKVYLAELVADADALILSGQTTSHQAAGEMVQSMNQLPGWTVEPPRSKLRKDQTVDCRISVVRNRHEQAG